MDASTRGFARPTMATSTPSLTSGTPVLDGARRHAGRASGSPGAPGRYAAHGASVHPQVWARESRSTFEVSGHLAERCDRLAGAIDGLAEVDLDELPDETVRDLLRRTQRQLDRLAAVRARTTGVLQSRLVRAAGPGREQRGIRDTRDFLTNDLRLPPSEAKRTEQTGAGLRRAPATAERFNAGELSQEHTRVITDTLRHLSGDTRDRAERELLSAATTQNPVQLGRTARRLLATLDYDAAVDQDDRRHARRYARVSQTPDGAVAINAMLYGIAGELALTAINAFQTADAAGDTPRRPEQRAADALEAILESALRTGDAPTQHGVRPHIDVVINYTDLAREAGIAELAFTGPITVTEIRRLLTDASLSRVVLGPDSAPLEVSAKVRTVPAALWTALKLRDRGCAWPDCTAPTGWCDVAHTTTPYRHEGRLTLDNAVLLCRRHHRHFDRTGWTATIDGPTVTFRPP